MTSNLLLGLRAETPIHAGTGQSVGAIDLPIQREAHTDWPCVFGSAVKGALRARAEDGDRLEEPLREAVFGPDTENASDHAGALLVGDARLLLLPVRSLTSHFKWVTCPDMLRRFQADAARLEHDLPPFDIPAMKDDEERESALIACQAPRDDADATILFLEEFRLTVERRDFSALIDALVTVIPGDAESVRGQLVEQLAVVGNELFGYLSRFAVPVAAHVAIDNEMKTVKGGALWYEETLPPETVLYVALSAWASRRKNDDRSGNTLLTEALGGLFGTHPYLQLGGNETVGMGWCQVNVPENVTQSDDAPADPAKEDMACA